MKIYIAGPMTGHPELNFPAFHAEAALLRGAGFEVVNPAEINADPSTPWASCMRKDIAELVTCDAIRLLPGWEKSRGAQIEHKLARDLELQVMESAPTQKLKAYTVYIRRKGGKTTGRIEVMATCETHSHRVAIRQLIDVSYPNTKPSNWLVTCTEERKV